MSKNCPNCGAPIDTVQCPYCRTILYDFAALDTEHPTYVRINHIGHILTAKTAVLNVILEMAIDAAPSLTVEMMALPDEHGCCFMEEKK